MKKMIVLATLMLSGCGAMLYIDETYGPVDRTGFKYSDQTYQIYDRKDLGKVMIAPSAGASIKSAFVKGQTFYQVDPEDDQTRYTIVAKAYLEKSRPIQLCNITKSQLLASPQWEFVYLCGDKQESGEAKQ